MSDNLQPFQYRIGNITFGKGTDIVVQSIDMQPYNVNNQDFQLPRSDEIRFGIDSLAPSPIIFSLGILNNYVLDGMEALSGFDVDDSLLARSRTTLSALSNEWKANAVRSSWGSMKPLVFCDADGVMRRIYGRPGKFAYAASKRGEQWIDAQAEFRRADTYAYNDVETYIEVLKGDNPTWIIQDGDAPAWLRILMYGPIENPVITIGDAMIELDIVVEEGTIVEVSSYPWSRRVIDSAGRNLRTKLRGTASYLDEIRLPPNELIPVRWGDLSRDEAMWTELPSSRWVENVDFLDLFTLWVNYKPITGGTFWSGNIVSGGYICGPFGLGAVIDVNNTFRSAGQFAQARVAADTAGKSAVVITSDRNMTNFACVEVENNWNWPVANQPPDAIRLMTGTSPRNLTERAKYVIPGGRLGLHDTIGIWRNDLNNEFTIQHNGEDVASWVDVRGEVNPDNRYQGFIVNSGNTPLVVGCGLDNLVAYDISVDPPSPEGKMYVLWRDAYHVA